MNLPEIGDTGESVRYWQYVHNAVRNVVNPPSPTIVLDGDYGEATAKAFLDFWKKSGGVGTTYKGTYVTAWLATKYHAAFARVSVPVPEPLPISDEKIKEYVHEYLDERMHSALKFNGELTGHVTLP